MNSKRLERAGALFWLSLAACACLGTMYIAKLLGAGWRLYTALGLGAGIGMLNVSEAWLRGKRLR